jgi:cell division septation protein DedD
MAVSPVAAATADDSDKDAGGGNEEHVEEDDDDKTIRPSFTTLSARRVQSVPSLRAPRVVPEVVISRPSAIKSMRQLVDNSITNAAVLQTSVKLPALTSMAAEHRVIASKPTLPKPMVEDAPVFGAAPAFIEGSSNMSTEVIDPENRVMMAHGSSVEGEFSVKLYLLS